VLHFIFEAANPFISSLPCNQWRIGQSHSVATEITRTFSFAHSRRKRLTGHRRRHHRIPYSRHGSNEPAPCKAKLRDLCANPVNQSIGAPMPCASDGAGIASARMTSGPCAALRNTARVSHVVPANFRLLCGVTSTNSDDPARSRHTDMTTLPS